MHGKRMVLGAASVAFAAGAAVGQPVYENIKIVAEDAEHGDWVGYDVAIGGGRIIVATIADAAYIFDTEGLQLHKLVGSDCVDRDDFGQAVAIGGGIAVVGAHNDHDNGRWSGSAFVFDAETGEEIGKLLAEDGAEGDNFGYSVATNGGTAVVGANDALPFGAAYVFDTATAGQLLKIGPDDTSEHLGHDVAMSGSVALVSTMNDDEAAPNCGAVYLFGVGSGEQLAKLLPSDPEIGLGFGCSVALHQDVAVVGAMEDNIAGSSDVGSAYVFDVSDPADPVEKFKFVPEDGRAMDWFGRSVGVSGNLAVVGSGNGSAYVYDTTTGAHIAQLWPSDYHSSFGYSVAIDGSIVVVGAPSARNHDGVSTGAVYLFNLAAQPCNAADLAEPFGVLDGADITAFVTAFLARDPAGDLDGNGLHELRDITLFVADYVAGCP